MTRKVCVVTGTRAEYGLLRLLMQDVRESASLSLQLVVTGSHLHKEFGFTYKEIESAGFTIDRKLEILVDEDDEIGVSKSMGQALPGFANTFHDLQPDIVVVLGDRYEILCAALAALVQRIPVAHLHGGELSIGAIDDAMRHAITKMSHLHFVANKDYYNRVVQLGENPERVFLVGGLGVDSIAQHSLIPRSELENTLGFKFGARNLLITFHPVTLEPTPAPDQLQKLLAALDEFPDVHLIFTLPNADAGGKELGRIIESYTKRRANASSFASLGQLRYFSCIAQVDGVVGNSSSGLTEVPSFKKGTVNIGDRQLGRLSGNSVINCPTDKAEICSAIRYLYSKKFQSSLSLARNPYGSEGATRKIIKVLESFPLDGLVKKTFYDLFSSNEFKEA